MFVGDYAFIPPAVGRSNNIDAEGNLGALRLRNISRVGGRITSRKMPLPFRRVPSLRAAGRYRVTLAQHLRGVTDDGYTDLNRDGYPQYGTTMDGMGWTDGASARQGEGLGFFEMLLAPLTQLIGGRQQQKALNTQKDLVALQAKASADAAASTERLTILQAQARNQSIAEFSKLAIPVVGIGAVALILSRRKSRK